MTGGFCKESLSLSVYFTLKENAAATLRPALPAAVVSLAKLLELLVRV